MKNKIGLFILVGIVSGLLVSGFHNIFTVPVIEDAIAIEEANAPPLAPGEVAEEPLVSLGVQRIGMAVGLAIFGMVQALIFYGIWKLFAKLSPESKHTTLMGIIGLIGFLSIALIPFLKYPLNPPGSGEEDTLLFRQGFQTLAFLLSAGGAVGLVGGMLWLNRNGAPSANKSRNIALLVAGYAVVLLVIFFALPQNPDENNLPSGLLMNFRLLTLGGHLMLWALLVLGGIKFLDRKREEPANPVQQIIRPAPQRS